MYCIFSFPDKGIRITPHVDCGMWTPVDSGVFLFFFYRGSIYT